MDCPECTATVLAVVAEVDPRTMSLRFTAQCAHPLTTEQTAALWRAGMRWPLPVVDGVGIIGAERVRQVIEEGYTPAHDEQHDDPNALTWAAWCLLDAAASGAPTPEPPSMWPFEEEAWKPEHTPLRRLVIAGAMIAAEIDRRLLEDRRKHGAR